MKRLRKKLSRLGALVLSVALMGTSADFSVLAAENAASYEGQETEADNFLLAVANAASYEGQQIEADNTIKTPDEVNAELGHKVMYEYEEEAPPNPGWYFGPAEQPAAFYAELDPNTGCLTIRRNGDYSEMPDIYNTESVTPWIQDGKSSQIKSVVIEDNITRIGSYLFYNCSNIESVEWVEALDSIGPGAFYGCSGLQELDLSNVAEIEEYAFYNIGEVEEVRVFCDADALGEEAFGGNTKINSLLLSCEWNKDEAEEKFNPTDGEAHCEEYNFVHLVPVDSNNTITEENDETAIIRTKCMETCNGLTETIKAPRENTYTGSAIGVDFELNNCGLVMELSPEMWEAYITYKDGVGNPISGKPVNAGTYTANYDNGIVQVSLEYEIEKATPTAEMFEYTPPADLNYDGSTKICNVVAAEGIVGMGSITISCYKDGVFSNPKNAGTYSVKIDVLEGTNYTAIEGLTSDDWTFTIAKPEMSVGIVANTLTFNGEEQELVSVTDVPDGCTPEYSVDGGNWSTQIPTAINAGEYTVSYKIAETDDYAAKEGSVVVTMERASYEPEEINKSYLYSRENSDSVSINDLLPTNCGSIGSYQVSRGKELSFSQEPSITDGILSYTLREGSINDTGIIKVIVETQNYGYITFKINVTLIDKIPVNVEAGDAVELNDNVLTYGEALSKLTFKEVAFTDADNNEVAGTLAWKTPDATPDAGTTSATWVFTPENEDYQVMEGELAIVVNKAVPVIAENPTVEERVYDSAVTLADVELLGGLVKGVSDNDLTGTWNWKDVGVIPTANNSGYVAVFTPVETANYEAVEVPVEVPVEKAQAVITIGDGFQSYTRRILDREFVLKDITFIGEGSLVYSVVEGETFDGEAKEAESIVTVSEDGVVSIHGTGTVKIYVGAAETENYYAALPQMISVEIRQENGLGEFFVKGDSEFTYTGKAIKPELEVYDVLNGLLTKNKDYTITFKNNKNAYTIEEGDEGFDASKAPQAIVKGKGKYGAVITVYFTILPKDISDMDDKSIIVKDILLEENGNVQKKVPVITYNGKKMKGILKPEDGSNLAKVKDFVYSYPQLEEEATKESAYKNAATWQIYVEGTGNYTGARYVDVIIASKGGKMTSAKIKKIPAQEYKGVAVDLSAEDLVVKAKIDGVMTTLERDKHYSVSYKDRSNEGIGTATVVVTGIPANGFSGSTSATFKITGTNIAKAEVKNILPKVYNGMSQTQKVEIKINKTVETENGKETQTETLLEGRDFTVTYDKNVNVGTAKMTIKGIGLYTGTIKKNFKITPYDMTGESDAQGTLKKDSFLMETNGLFSLKDGELSLKYVKGGVKTPVGLVFNGRVLVEGKDYTVSYKNNKNVYTLKEGDEGYKAKKAPVVTITGKGNFKGSVSKTFIITGRTLTEANMEVVMKVDDKAVSTKKGGYISKPVLTDVDGKVLKQGKDYEEPVYTMRDESGQTVTLGKNDKVTKVGTEITVTVKGMGAYAGSEENPSIVVGTYLITARDFTKIKVSTIVKPYTGRKVTLTEEDFYTINNLGQKVSRVTIKNGTNEIYLEYGEDFEIVEGTYKNNLKNGTASVMLRGISDTANGGSGLYGGTKTITFRIGSRGFGDWFWWLEGLFGQ